MQGDVSIVWLEQFVQLIGAQTGLEIRRQDYSSLAATLSQRIKALGLDGPAAYYELLEAAGPATAHPSSLALAANAEWKLLTQEITTGESYFFRDRGQISVLREHLFPTLIKAKRAAVESGQQTQLSLRVWSAGCSTGEEAYTLAILLRDLLPDIAQWNLQILATDVNPAAIQKAELGLYKRWSFRQTSPDLKRHFTETAQGWQIHSHIRQMITFRHGNLLQDSAPTTFSITHGMDLILCRNVFIYFGAEAIAQVLRRFHDSLSPEGYLMVGHAELQGQDLSQFQTLNFPESLVYQRPLVPTSTALKQPTDAEASQTALLPMPQPVAVKPSCSPTRIIRPWQTQTAVVPAPSELKQPVAVTPAPHNTPTRAQPEIQTAYTAHLWMAEQYFAEQRYDMTIAACEAAAEVAPEAVEPLLLWAEAALALADDRQAKVLYKKIIYLEPALTDPYLALAEIYHREGDVSRAMKMKNAARTLTYQAV